MLERMDIAPIRRQQQQRRRLSRRPPFHRTKTTMTHRWPRRVAYVTVDWIVPIGPCFFNQIGSKNFKNYPRTKGTKVTMTKVTMTMLRRQPLTLLWTIRTFRCRRMNLTMHWSIAMVVPVCIINNVILFHSSSFHVENGIVSSARPIPTTTTTTTKETRQLH